MPTERRQLEPPSQMLSSHRQRTLMASYSLGGVTASPTNPLLTRWLAAAHLCSELYLQCVTPIAEGDMM